MSFDRGSSSPVHNQRRTISEDLNGSLSKSSQHDYETERVISCQDATHNLSEKLNNDYDDMSSMLNWELDYRASNIDFGSTPKNNIQLLSKRSSQQALIS